MRGGMVPINQRGEKLRELVFKTISWWAMRDSNPRPTACKAAALPLRQSPEPLDMLRGIGGGASSFLRLLLSSSSSSSSSLSVRFERTRPRTTTRTSTSTIGMRRTSDCLCSRDGQGVHSGAQGVISPEPMEGGKGRWTEWTRIAGGVSIACPVNKSGYNY